MISPIRGTSLINIGGSLTRDKKSIDVDLLTRQRLRAVYPEANQRVFSGIIPSLVNKNAYQFELKRFMETVRLEMVAVCQHMYPAGDYKKETGYTLLYMAISNFIDRRDAALSAIGTKISTKV